MLLWLRPQGRNMYTGRCANGEKFADYRTGLHSYNIWFDSNVTLQVIQTDKQAVPRRNWYLYAKSP
jgi:hypothetical protein